MLLEKVEIGQTSKMLAGKTRIVHDRDTWEKFHISVCRNTLSSHTLSSREQLHFQGCVYNII